MDEVESDDRSAPAAGGPRPARLLRRLARGLTIAAGAVALVALGAGLFLWLTLCASLPRTRGTEVLPGLAAPARVDRDALGTPAISGAGRLDVARVTGYVHAQERFFQMDLLRRRAAGELAALFGPALLDGDRRVRPHRFRDLARRVVAAAPADSRALLEAYAGGVNSGLRALGRPPFEYLATRTTPAPWAPEDSVLVLLSMFLELQDDRGERETAFATMHETLPAALFDFLATRGTRWDAPLEGGPLADAPLPGPEVVDLRVAARAAGREPGGGAENARGGPAGAGALDPTAGAAETGADPDDLRAGSNNWAVAGRLTADGGALVANDMHLGLGVPNIWFHAALSWPEEGSVRRIAGVTLPGVPVLVAGSTGRVAWGFTNTHADWGDLVDLDTDGLPPDTYRAPDGPRPFGHARETIEVRGAPSETLDVVTTLWGPVVPGPGGRRRSWRWVADDPAAVNVELWRLEGARDLGQALRLAAESGIPAQNFVCADAAGRIGWTIAGRIPRRFGIADARLPSSWADGARGWNGWLDPEEYPRLVDPPSGRLFTANQRVVAGAAYALIGDGGYDLGFRAGMIRDDLLAIERATPRDLLGVQLDDRALFLARWRDLLLAALTPEAAAASPVRAEARRLLATNWTGRASIDSAAYRIVRATRRALASALFDALTAPCRAADPKFDASWIGQREGPLWRLVTERPAHLLPARDRSWDEAILAALDGVLEDLTRDGTALRDATWGRRNTARIRHPLSLAVPRLAPWLDMPAEPLPGDDSMPRVQGPDFGASERFVVSPGREESGLFEMPGGESGHPLSAHYRDGHAAWAHGLGSPFLPGPAVESLTLLPSEGAAPVTVPAPGGGEARPRP